MRLSADSWNAVLTALAISERYYRGRLDEPPGKLSDQTQEAARFRRIYDTVWTRLPKEVKDKLVRPKEKP